MTQAALIREEKRRDNQQKESSSVALKQPIELYTAETMDRDVLSKNSDGVSKSKEEAEFNQRRAQALFDDWINVVC